MNLSRLFAATAALVVMLLSLLALPAAAHTGFEHSDPMNGSTVSGELHSIVLSFTGQAEPAGEGFVILDPTGVTRTPDSITPGPEQRVWTLGFDPPLSGGPVGVRWTVQAPDAHPIEGSFSFTVDAQELAEQPDDEPNGTADSLPPSTADRQTTITDSPASTSDEPTAEAASTEEATIESAAAASQDLEAFLAESETEVANAEGVGAFGRILGFVGTMLGIGGLVFAAVVLHGHRDDTVAVLRLVRHSAALVLIGTVIDFVAHLAVAGEAWSAMWSETAAESVALSSYGIAVGLRSASALLLLLASTANESSSSNRPPPAPVQTRPMVTVGAQTVTLGVFAGPTSEIGETLAKGPGSDIGQISTSRFGQVDPPPEVGPLTYSTIGQDQPHSNVKISPTMAASIIALLVSFTFDGHTVSEGNRWITGAVDMVHVVAGAIWAGGVLALAIVLWRRHRRRLRLQALELAVRFSVVAGAALAAAGVAGTVLAIIILDSLSELWTTPWGLLLIAKFTAVGAAAGLGTFNHFIVVPWIEADPDDDSRSVMLRNTATGEALLLGVVLAVTAFLVGAASS